VSKQLFSMFEKASNYSVLAIVINNTIGAMKRFDRVSREKIITNIYTKLKEKAGNQV